jgi:hypothetical protein
MPFLDNCTWTPGCTYNIESKPYAGLSGQADIQIVKSGEDFPKSTQNASDTKTITDLQETFILNVESLSRLRRNIGHVRIKTT